MSKVTYRKLKGYKYQISEPFALEIGTPRELPRDLRVFSDWVQLTRAGAICVAKGYCWDGPSGPTIDTDDFLRASLVHDALYQLMREGELDYRRDRRWADIILRRLCIEDGMPKSRARYVYQAVRTFARSSARPSSQPLQTIFTAP